MKDKVFELIAKEEKRQEETLMMIPSENYTSSAVRKAVGSVLMHKYSEGYPGKRYYQGNKFIDEIENLAIERAKKLFSVPYVNVQALSGAVANSAVYFALLNPDDKIMGMALSSGGHLTHSHPKITFSGKYFQPVQYNIGKDGWIDYKKVEELAKKEKPKIIVCGYTAYPRIIDFEKFGKIADKVGAYLLADIAHIAGLVAGGVHPSPVAYVDVVTTTTHKTLRGPRGAIIMITKKGLEKDSQMSQKIDRAVFPGLQGGPHDNQTAGIAVCLAEASTLSFKKYAAQIVKNAKALAGELKKYGFNLVTGGTDNHLILIDLRNKNIDGKKAAEILEEAGIVVNKNTIPFDPNPPANPSGIRLGTPALTTRGMKEREMKLIASWINEILNVKCPTSNVQKIKKEVKKLCKNFPLPKN